MATPNKQGWLKRLVRSVVGLCRTDSFTKSEWQPVRYSTLIELRDWSHDSLWLWWMTEIETFVVMSCHVSKRKLKAINKTEKSLKMFKSLIKKYLKILLWNAIQGPFEMWCLAKNEYSHEHFMYKTYKLSKKTHFCLWAEMSRMCKFLSLLALSENIALI